jgi:hypothetical protein
VGGPPPSGSRKLTVGWEEPTLFEVPSNGTNLAIDRDFDQWWEEYPRKVAKGAARTRWMVLARGKKLPPIDQLIDATRRYKQTEQVAKGFICHPATWLHQERWSDEVEIPTTTSRPAPPVCPECGVANRTAVCPLGDIDCSFVSGKGNNQ